MYVSLFLNVSSRFLKGPQGSSRFLKVPQGSCRFLKVPQSYSRSQKFLQNPCLSILQEPLQCLFTDSSKIVNIKSPMIKITLTIYNWVTVKTEGPMSSCQAVGIQQESWSCLGSLLFI